MNSVHRHPCERCGWWFVCTCNDPESHDGRCFECATMPVQAHQVQNVTPEPDLDLFASPTATLEGWERV